MGAPQEHAQAVTLIPILRPLDPNDNTILSPRLKFPVISYFPPFPNGGICAFICSDVPTSNNLTFLSLAFNSSGGKFLSFILQSTFAHFTTHTLIHIHAHYTVPLEN